MKTMQTMTTQTPYDHCHTCQRKVVKGVVECVKCYMKRLYGTV
jgi:hypothetical protein